MKIMKIEKTKRGFPAMWESGGGCTNTGAAVIIANGDGTAKEPVYVRRRGSLACAHHALFVVHEGDMIIEAEHHRRDFNIRIWHIDQIQEEEAWLTLIYEYSRGEWDMDPEENFMPAIEAAVEKATCYHCREPHYAREQAKLFASYSPAGIGSRQNTKKEE